MRWASCAVSVRALVRTLRLRNGHRLRLTVNGRPLRLNVRVLRVMRCASKLRRTLTVKDSRKTMPTRCKVIRSSL